MKKFFNIFMLFWIICLSKAQTNPFPIQCVTDTKNQDLAVNPIENPTLEIPTSGACNNTSKYFNTPSLYLPKSTDEPIVVRMNFIFLTKPDGTGNFEQNSLEHNQVIDDIVAAMNFRLMYLESPDLGCEGYNNNNLTTTRLQVVVNKIWKIDPAWDFLVTGFNPSCGNPEECPSNQMLYPANPSMYYYNYFDSDPSIPLGINVVFSNDGTIYNDFINGQYASYPKGPTHQWAASQFPSFDLDQKLREFYPNLFNKYLWMKNYVADNPNLPQDPNTPWSVVRSWFVGIGYGSFPHELGHNLGLSHHDCSTNIMSYSNLPPATHDYFSNNDIQTMFSMASLTSARKYFTEDSFKNANLNVISDENWDLNFRLYSNVKIDHHSTLTATCKIIMAPESRFIVKDGSNFIIEGAEITSANNSSWNGIKVEGKGSLLINPNTLIDTKYFYAYADNSPLPGGKMSSETKELLKENSVVNEDYKIYPNPTGDFINIETTNKISKVEVYNLLNKSFAVKYKSNQVDVRNLPQGNFILKIHSDTGLKTINFIKK